MRIVATLIMLLFCPAMALTAAEIHVPADHYTIQAGIDAAVNGDTVIVADGNWTGAGNVDLTFDGKAITVRSENGPAACIIDCGSEHRGFFFQNSGEERDSVVSGFTITNADLDAIGGGGGIYIANTSPTIDNCWIINNRTAYTGGGIYCGGGNKSPLITGCRINGNEAGSGGGIFIDGTSGSDEHPLVTDCEISGNSATSRGGGVYIGEIVYTEFHNCLVVNNTSGQGGGAFYLWEAHPRWYSCTIVGNTAGWDGGAICNDGLYAGGGQVRDSILRGNSPDEIWDQLFFTTSVFHTNIEGGHVGTGNIDSDPLFVTGPGGDCYLAQIAAGQLADSPCLDAGSDAAFVTCFETADGTVCLDLLSTRTDEEPDTGQADMGYHYARATGTVTASLNCSPSSGQVPFTSNFGLMISNAYDQQTRRLAGRIDVTLGNGRYYPNWRAGFTNLAPGQNLAHLWPQAFPALVAVIGDNVFQLMVEDVTPPPWNQPPYPPAGDTATDSCTVTAGW